MYDLEIAPSSFLYNFCFPIFQFSCLVAGCCPVHKKGIQLDEGGPILAGVLAKRVIGTLPSLVLEVMFYTSFVSLVGYGHRFGTMESFH